jgi:hypothetical protein
MTADEKAAYDQWVASRPERVRRVLARLDGWTAYRMRHDDGTYSGALYTLASVDEPLDPDAPCTVKVQRFDASSGEPMWTVFGIDPDTLETVGPAINDGGRLRVGSTQ